MWQLFCHPMGLSKWKQRYRCKANMFHFLADNQIPRSTYALQSFFGHL